MKRRNFIRSVSMGVIATGVGVTRSATAENLLFNQKQVASLAWF